MSKRLYQKAILQKPWVHFFTRPFNLFETSLWQDWYSSKVFRQAFGCNMNQALFIEEKENHIVAFRNPKELESFEQSIVKLVQKNPRHFLTIMKQGKNLHKQAETYCKKGETPFITLSQILDFYYKTSIYGGVVPLFLQATMDKNGIKNRAISKTCKELRRVSYYNSILKKIVIPFVKNELKKATGNPRILETITLLELNTKRYKNAQARIIKRKHGQYFVYEYNNGKESILYTQKPQSYINKLLTTKTKTTSVLEGKTSYPGWAKGKARVITNPNKKWLFKKGDILVTVNSNPAFMPYIKKAGAIVADEGGITSHASIISRELKIPCVIGTKIATKVLKDDDIVEVDANKGIIKIIKQT